MRAIVWLSSPRNSSGRCPAKESVQRLWHVISRFTLRSVTANNGAHLCRRPTFYVVPRHHAVRMNAAMMPVARAGRASGGVRVIPLARDWSRSAAVSTDTHAVSVHCGGTLHRPRPPGPFQLEGSQPEAKHLAVQKLAAVALRRVCQRKATHLSSIVALVRRRKLHPAPVTRGRCAPRPIT